MNIDGKDYTIQEIEDMARAACRQDFYQHLNNFLIHKPNIYELEAFVRGISLAKDDYIASLDDKASKALENLMLKQDQEYSLHIKVIRPELSYGILSSLHLFEDDESQIVSGCQVKGISTIN